MSMPQSKVDTSFAEAYENMLVPSLIASWARALVEEVRIPRGCGARGTTPARFPSTEASVADIAQGAPSSRLALAKVSASGWPDFLAEVDDTLVPWKCPGSKQRKQKPYNLHGYQYRRD
jgi:hypothetical protein